MLVISDVHYATDALRRVIARGEPMLILGDLVNLTDYRTGEGAIAEVLGLEFARRAAASRGSGDFSVMREMWEEATRGRIDEVRSAIGRVIAEQYAVVSEALVGGSGYVIHGNVDRPDILRETLPESFEYVHGEKRVIDGVVFGFVGGGVETPLRASGELSEAEMHRVLQQLGPVDVLCSHVPPAVDSLRTDVITGRAERGSTPILDYILEYRPKHHLFGDVHQPQAGSWRIGGTVCRNVGYFRATGRALRIDISSLA